MKTLQRTIKAVIRPGNESGDVAECLEVAVVTQGATLNEVAKNLLEAVSLLLEGEDPESFGLVANPSLLLMMELEPAYSVAYRTLDSQRERFNQIQVL